MNIAKIDLNLLLVFAAVYDEQNTVRAAERLGLSQPAVSHALNRLRGLVSDKLFVRAARGVIPTPRAHEMQKSVRVILESAEGIFLRKAAFDPKTEIKTFRIATTDYFEQVVFPLLLEFLEKEAPGITIISRPTQGQLPREELESGNFDLAIAGFYTDIPDRYFQQKLFQDDFVCVARKDVSELRGELTMEKYAKLRHIAISPQGDLETKSKAILRKRGIEIRYIVGVTSFLSPAQILSTSNLVLTCPRKLAASFLENFPFKIHELPFKIPPITVVQVWHERLQEDPAHRWLRGIINDLCAKT